MIKLEGVTLAFEDKLVLNDLYLEVLDGKITALIGLSGAGKSTVLKVIMGFLQVQKGKVYVAGKDITKLNERELNEIRKNMGLVFQHAALFDYMTCGDNVAFGLRRLKRLKEKEVQKKVRDTLKIVGLEGIEHLYPDEVSGGMRKRVGFARAIAYEPKVLLYDEPTSGLDPIMTSVINNLIVKLNKELEVTTLVVTHDLASVLKYAHKIAMLHNGKIIEEGSPQEFVASKKAYVRQFLEGREEGPIKVL